MEQPRPAMRGHYSIRNPLWNLIFSSIDVALTLCNRTASVFGRTAPEVPKSPKRILICSTAHLGDVVAATAALPVLRDAFPDAEFGFLAGSWSQVVLKGHPVVKTVHVLDHWMQNRSALPRREKWRIYRRTRVQALHEIKAMRYDIAVDLAWNLPNVLPLLWQAGIPVRAGFGSAGFGPLATHCCQLSDTHQHISERYRALLRRLGIEAQSVAKLTPMLADISEKVAAEAAMLGSNELLVLHPGAGAEFREWPEENWHALAEKLTGDGYTLAFTGYGVLEEAMISRIIGPLPRCINLCGRLSWDGFAATLAQARLLICVDTAAGHVAGAVGTPSVVITAGRYPYLWKPMGAASQVLTAPVPCAPCHLNNGCAGMECLRNLDAARVYDACQEMLAASADICSRTFSEKRCRAEEDDS